MKFSNPFKNNFKERELELAEAQLYDAKMQANTYAQELMLKKAMLDYADQRVNYLKALVTTIKGETNEVNKTTTVIGTSTGTTKAPFSY